MKERVGAGPEGLALVDPPNTTALVGRDPVRWSWNRLDERVDVLAAFLLARGVRAGDVVAVQLPNCSALVQAFLAIVRIGAIVTPFPVSYREHEMGPMCRRTGVVGVITSSRYGGRELAGAALGLGVQAPSVRFVVARGDDEPAEGGSNEGTALLSGPIDMPDPEQRASFFPNYASDVTWSTPVADWTSVRLHDPVSGGWLR